MMNREKLAESLAEAYKLAHLATKEGQIEYGLHFAGAMLLLKEELFSHINGVVFHNLFYEYLDNLNKIERMKDRILSLGGSYSDIFSNHTDDEKMVKLQNNLEKK